MIPKVIHYCWLSGEPYPELVRKCIDSWSKYLPDYELILWDTNRIDINSNVWLSQAYNSKKYAFAADYIRFYALYHYGGIYLDADVEVLKSFNSLVGRDVFLGEEASGDIEAAVMGCEKGMVWVKECLEYYNERTFIIDNKSYDMTPVPLLVSKVAEKHKLDIFAYDYFSPKNYHLGKTLVSKNTYCIHHFDGKWLDKGGKFVFKRCIHRLLYVLFGRKGHNKLVKLIRKSK